MNYQTLITLLTTIGRVLDPKLLRRIPPVIRSFRHPVFSYENLSLSYALDIQDIRGERARLEREQQVRFLTSETGVVRDLVWGDGEPNVRYRASGARAVNRQQEGLVQVVWLGLPSRPVAGERAIVRSSRTIVGGLKGKNEYLEVRVERPTVRLKLSVMFPWGRRPSSAWLDGIPNLGLAGQRLDPKLCKDGRVTVEWRAKDVRPETYRLRWSW